MRAFPTAVLAEIAKASIFPVSLLEIGSQNAPLRLCTADVPVGWNSHEWAPRGVTYASSKTSLGIQQASYDLVVDNRDSGMTAWLQAAGAEGPLGYATTIYECLCDPASVDGSGRLLPVGDYAWQEFSGRNTAFKIELDFTITVKTAYDLYRARGPSREQSTLCRFRGRTGINGFKGANCGYAGAETVCNFTFSRCTELGNNMRFGGFPDVDDRPEE